MHSGDLHCRPVSGPMCCMDRRLWCECFAMLARSLVGYEGLLPPDCMQQCEEGVCECERGGEWELAASIKMALALHAMTKVPQDLKTVIVHSQVSHWFILCMHLCTH